MNLCCVVFWFIKAWTRGKVTQLIIRTKSKMKHETENWARDRWWHSSTERFSLHPQNIFHNKPCFLSVNISVWTRFVLKEASSSSLRINQSWIWGLRSKQSHSLFVSCLSVQLKTDVKKPLIPGWKARIVYGRVWLRRSQVFLFTSEIQI